MCHSGTMDISTADLYDEHGETLASVSLQFQDLGGKVRLQVRCAPFAAWRTTAW